MEGDFYDYYSSCKSHVPHGNTQVGFRLSSTNAAFNVAIGPQTARGTHGSPAQTHFREWQLQGDGNTLEGAGDL